MRTGVVVVCLAVGLAGCGGGSHGNAQSDYVSANKNMLSTLPAYPHAKLTTQATTGYTTGKAKTAGYQTRFLYKLPAKATVQRVEAFYLKRLQQDWKQVASLTGPVLNYRKGNAFISLNLTQVGTHQLEIVVDQAFYSHTGG